ncbi:hypothetical protein KHA80_19795 [Anaerobacillus sp. HL2]|nr:hypothetical protein KHA80_19795 [Anaerobacillus sp. HL2]
MQFEFIRDTATPNSWSFTIRSENPDLQVEGAGTIEFDPSTGSILDDPTTPELDGLAQIQLFPLTHQQ